MAVSRGNSVTAADYNAAVNSIRSFFTRISRTATASTVAQGSVIYADNFNRLSNDYTTARNGYVASCTSYTCSADHGSHCASYRAHIGTNNGHCSGNRAHIGTNNSHCASNRAHDGTYNSHCGGNWGDWCTNYTWYVTHYNGHWTGNRAHNGGYT